MAGDRTEEEIHAVKEILAIKEGKSKLGTWEGALEGQAEVCVPPEFRHMEDWDIEQLRKHLKRLQRRGKSTEEFDELP